MLAAVVAEKGVPKMIGVVVIESSNRNVVDEEVGELLTKSFAYCDSHSSNCDQAVECGEYLGA